MNSQHPPFKDSILSQSFINLYLKCPHSAWLRYAQKHQPYFVDDTYLKIGKSGHKILENFYPALNLEAQDIEQEFMEKMKQTAFQYWDRSVDASKRDAVEQALYGWLKQETKKFINYKKQGCLGRFKPITVEEDIIDYNQKLRAIIDKRCIGISGIQYCIDYKFDSKLPAKRNFEGILNDIDIEYKIQAAINTMVLKSQNININTFYYQFVRYPEKLLSVPLTDSLFNEVNQIIEKIRNDTTFEKNPKGCFWCNFKMYCKLEQKGIGCT